MKTMSETCFDAGLLLNGDDPNHPIRLVGGDRGLELIGLGVAAPVGMAGYVTQIATGSRKVRLDAMAQLQRAGIRFSIDIGRIEV